MSTALPLLLMLVGQPDAGPELRGEAISHGGGSCGKLEGGVAVPCHGNNYEAFADTACALGRNYLHPRVRDTVVDAFESLHADRPTRRWQYGELGKAEGGALWPHKTHQNGLSADFFVPVVGATGQPTLVPISATNKFGYGLEFSKNGVLGERVIDWSAIGAHLLALESAGAARGVRIERIILTPDFHRRLFRENPGVRRLAPLFMQKEAWVRHDEHYHVDFGVPRELRRALRCAK
jgi:penicillin-insensitive murein endopeptidase